MIGEYNTSRPHIILKEYGRNVQKLIEYIRNIPDKEKRTDLSYTLIELIKQLTPSIKEQGEDPQRMWDDLYIIADFDLDVNNPFPVPERDILFMKPQRMAYPQSDVRFKHYGKNIEKLVKEALKKEDPQEREDAPAPGRAPLHRRARLPRRRASLDRWAPLHRRRARVQAPRRAEASGPSDQAGPGDRSAPARDHAHPSAHR